MQATVSQTAPAPITRRFIRRPLSAAPPRAPIPPTPTVVLAPEVQQKIESSKAELIAAFERDLKRVADQQLKQLESHRAELQLEEKRIASSWVGINQGLERLGEAGPEQLAILQASNQRAFRAILELQLRNESLEGQIDPFELMPSLAWAKKFWADTKNIVERASTEAADMVDRVAKGSGQLSATEVTRIGRQMNELLQIIQEWIDNVGFHIAERQAQGR